MIRISVIAITGYLLMVLSFQGQAQKQYRGYELGLRFGETFGGRGALDAMIPFYGNRIHANLSFYKEGVIVAGLYNWGFPIGEGFVFYPGAGGVMSLGEKVYLGVAGELGFEYAFDIPLSIGMDWRPVVGVLTASGFIADGFGLNVRYRF